MTILWLGLGRAVGMYGYEFLRLCDGRALYVLGLYSVTGGKGLMRSNFSKEFWRLSKSYTTISALWIHGIRNNLSLSWVSMLTMRNQKCSDPALTRTECFANLPVGNLPLHSLIIHPNVMLYNHPLLQRPKVTTATTANKPLLLLPSEVEAAFFELMIVMFCVSARREEETFPVDASSCSCADRVVRIVVDRPAGQKTTSKPPPEGIMKVEVWSSNAKYC